MIGTLQHMAQVVGDMGATAADITISVADRIEVTGLVDVGAEGWGFVHADGSVAEVAVLRLGIAVLSVSWTRPATEDERSRLGSGEKCSILWSPSTRRLESGLPL